MARRHAAAAALLIAAAAMLCSELRTDVDPPIEHPAPRRPHPAAAAAPPRGRRSVIDVIDRRS
eukprot:gene4489-315_t